MVARRISCALSPGKRHTPEHDYEIDDEDAVDEQPPKRTKLGSSTQSRGVETRPLACPMFKFDPKTYSQCESYVAGGVSRLNRLR